MGLLDPAVDLILYYTSVRVLSLFHQQAKELIIRIHLHTVFESDFQKKLTSLFDKAYWQLLYFMTVKGNFVCFSSCILQSSF